jgi:RNA polymerase sigma-70 factor (ECF subfamily)
MQLFNKIKSLLGKSRGDYATLADERLVDLYVQSRDEEAFFEICMRHCNYIYGLALRITGNHQSAEEVLQEVMLQLFQKLHTFAGEARFSSWLYRVTANASYSYLRSKKKEEQEVSLEDYVPYDEMGTLRGKIVPKGWSTLPEEELLEREALDVIEKAIGELPDLYRTVIVLRDIEGFTNEEVAETLGISVGAVKTRLHRARLALRDKISDYFHERSK